MKHSLRLTYVAAVLTALVLIAAACGGGSSNEESAPGAPGTAAPASLPPIDNGGDTPRHFPPDSEVLAIVEELVDSDASTGIVVGMLEADGSRRYVAYGDPGPGARPLGSKSVFEIASITKVFTGVLLADMDLRGELSVDDPVAGFLPEGVSMPSRNGAEITLAHLATHRSGLPRMPDNIAPGDSANPFANYTEQQLYDFLSGYVLPRDIGARFEYSNVGVGLLGHVLGRRAGSDYETLLRERILEPLGMSMSGIKLTPEMREWLALGHDAGGDVVPNWDIPTLEGMGALRSNAEDMLSFLGANIEQPSTQLQEAMRLSHESREPALGGDARIGLNWIILPVGDDQIVWHDGETGGYRAFAGFDPAAGVGVVVLTNSFGPQASIAFGLHLINPDYPLKSPPASASARIEVEVSEEILAAYVGVYELTPDVRITVTLEEGQLQMQATGGVKIKIYPESETEFFLRVVDAQITFVLDDSGEVTELILPGNGPDRVAKRLR